MNHPDLEMHKMLVLSTGHLPGPITKENAPNLIWYEKGDYGWLVYTHLFRHSVDTTPELIEILKFAASQDCEWVMFDCDVPTVSLFPEFEW